MSRVCVLAGLVIMAFFCISAYLSDIGDEGSFEVQNDGGTDSPRGAVRHSDRLPQPQSTASEALASTEFIVFRTNLTEVEIAPTAVYVLIGEDRERVLPSSAGGFLRSDLSAFDAIFVQYQSPAGRVDATAHLLDEECCVVVNGEFLLELTWSISPDASITREPSWTCCGAYVPDKGTASELSGAAFPYDPRSFPAQFCADVNSRPHLRVFSIESSIAIGDLRESGSVLSATVVKCGASVFTIDSGGLYKTAVVQVEPPPGDFLELETEVVEWPALRVRVLNEADGSPVGGASVKVTSVLRGSTDSPIYGPSRIAKGAFATATNPAGVTTVKAQDIGASDDGGEIVLSVLDNSILEIVVDHDDYKRLSVSVESGVSYAPGPFDVAIKPLRDRCRIIFRDRSGRALQGQNVLVICEALQLASTFKVSGEGEVEFSFDSGQHAGVVRVLSGAHSGAVLHFRAQRLVEIDL